MKTILVISVSIFGLISCTPQKENNEVVNNLTENELIAKGNYLVNIIGCHDCHTPKIMTERGPMPDTLNSMAGHVDGDLSALVSKEALSDWVLFNGSLTAAVGPWGISYSANLTSDASGIGSWTEDQFIIAMRDGKYKGIQNSRDLLPPMPWQNFTQMKDDDLKAIFAYLKSTKPVRNVVPPAVSPEELDLK
ncbi:MAG: c-type cytochrome [Bacteroidales bacterium]